MKVLLESKRLHKFVWSGKPGNKDEVSSNGQTSLHNWNKRNRINLWSCLPLDQKRKNHHQRENGYWQYSSNLLKHLSRLALPHVNSLITHLQIYASHKALGKERTSTNGKKLGKLVEKKWVEKDPSFGLVCNEILRVLLNNEIPYCRGSVQ